MSEPESLEREGVRRALSDLEYSLSSFRGRCSAIRSELGVRESLLESVTRECASDFSTSCAESLATTRSESDRAVSFSSLQTLALRSLTDVAVSVSEEDAMWKVFCERVARETGGAVSVVCHAGETQEFSAVREQYAPLLRKRHEEVGATVEVVRVFGLRYSHAVERGQPQQFRLNGARRMGRTMSDFSSLSDIMAPLQISGCQQGGDQKAAWGTPQHSPRPAGGAETCAGSCSEAERLLRRLAEELGESPSIITELARSTAWLDDDRPSSRSSADESPSSPETPAEHSACLRSCRWERRCAELVATCGEDWFYSATAPVDGAARLPSFGSGVLLSSSVVEWMRPEPDLRQCGEGALYFCQEEKSGKIPDGAISGSHVVQMQTGWVGSKRLRTLEARRDDPSSPCIHFVQASVRDLLRLSSVRRMLDNKEVSEKDRATLAGRYRLDKLQKIDGTLYQVMASGRCKWVAALTIPELCELVFAYILRSWSRRPSAAVIFPDLHQAEPQEAGTSFRHHYCFLYPSFGGSLKSAPRPDFLVQYDLHSQTTVEDSAERSESQCLVSGRCAWQGCASTDVCRTVASLPLLFLCPVHAEVFASCEQKRRKESGLSRRKLSTCDSIPLSILARSEPRSLLSDPELIATDPLGPQSGTPLAAKVEQVARLAILQTLATATSSAVPNPRVAKLQAKASSMKGSLLFPRSRPQSATSAVSSSSGGTSRRHSAAKRSAK